MKERVLITGGAGFIGSHTADALGKRGYRVRILDNLGLPIHNGRWPNYVSRKNYELIRGDVRKRKDWLRALKGVDYVYHFAAYQDERPEFSRFFETNTVSTALLYELVRAKRLPIKRVILASSQFVYGDGRYMCSHTKRSFYPELRDLRELQRKRFDIFCSHGTAAKFFPFREDQALNPTNSYGLSKQALENLALRLGKTHDIVTTILRYSIVQGPRQSPQNLYSGALRIFAVQALRGRPITVYEDGRQMRDFISIKDAVSATLLVLKNSKADFEVFNVGGGHACSVLDLATMVKRESASSSPIVIGGFRRTDTRHALSDISKLKKLGWKPRFTPQQSVKDYLLWYRQEFLKRRQRF